MRKPSGSNRSSGGASHERSRPARYHAARRRRRAPRRQRRSARREERRAADHGRRAACERQGHAASRAAHHRRLGDVVAARSARRARSRYEGRQHDHDRRGNVDKARAPYTLVRKLAASFDLCGPLLGRFGRAEVPLPGGCVLGTRATDMHEAAFRALDADVSIAARLSDRERAQRPAARRRDRVSHAERRRDEERDAGGGPRRGDTTIHNAAMEPEVVDLANFLVAMGAKIAGQGGDTIVIDGVAGAARRRVRDHPRPHRRPARCCSPARSRAAT